MNGMNNSRLKASLAVSLGGLLLALAACGSDDSDTGGDGGSSDATAAAEERVAELEDRVGGDPPSSGPTAQADKNVWVITCGDAVESCQRVADGNVEAGEALGWDITRFDSKGDPEIAGEGIRQAITDSADGIVVSSLDCILLKAPLREAKNAGIPTIGAGNSDCNDPVAGDGSPSLFTMIDLLPFGAKTYSEFLAQWGADKAAYAIAETGGDVKAINLEQAEVPNIAFISKGFADGLNECSGCEVVETIKYTFGDVTNGNVTQFVSNALAEHPEANVIHLPYDGLILPVAPAIRESGRSDELLVIAGEGFASALDSIRAGDVVDAVVGLEINWESWQNMDDLNRYFAGEDQVYGGWGYTIIDGDTNLPDEGGFDSNLDYRSAYEDIWSEQ